MIHSSDSKNPMISLALHKRTTGNENETYFKLSMIISSLLEYLPERIGSLPWDNHCATYLTLNPGYSPMTKVSDLNNIKHMGRARVFSAMK